jgi:hypothetical protein
MKDRPDRVAPPANGAPIREDGDPSAAALFTVLWEALADLLGNAAAAALLRRAARRATPDSPELGELAILREGMEYRYALPPAWHDKTTGTYRALQNLVGELMPILADLTGPVAVRHLARVREVRERGIIPPLKEGT